MEENIQQDVKKLQGELKRITNRKNQIDKISQKLYEDRALEKIPEDRYLSLSTVYDEEYTQLTSRKEEIESLLTEIETNKENIQFFTQLIEKYSDIQELNARILNELIEKIVVSEKEIIDGEKYQCVHIYYKFVGLMIV